MSLPNAYDSTKEPILCHFKRKVGLGFCRYWIAKVGLVVDAKTWHNCENCLRVRVSLKDNKVTSQGDSK